jgi:hypothetical protein
LPGWHLNKSTQKSLQSICHASSSLVSFYNLDFLFRQPIQLIDQGIDLSVCGLDLALRPLQSFPSCLLPFGILVERPLENRFMGEDGGDLVPSFDIIPVGKQPHPAGRSLVPLVGLDPAVVDGKLFEVCQDRERQPGKCSELQIHIHQAIEALNGYLVNGQNGEVQTPTEMDEMARREDFIEIFVAAEAGSTEAVRNRALYHLKHIYDTITQIASGVGVPMTSASSTQKGKSLPERSKVRLR